MTYINIALAKGRLGVKGYKLFEKMGITCPDLLESSRKLIFENLSKQTRFILVKPQDVPIYVQGGVADIGIVGKDTLLEEEKDIYELLDLRFGKCQFAVAAMKDFNIKDKSKSLKVATKYPNVARNFYLSRNEHIEIINLQGSVELAPILGLSDVIVDIVETGDTIKENGLKVIEYICPLSARLVCNKASFSTKTDRITEIINGLGYVLEEENLSDRNCLSKSK